MNKIESILFSTLSSDNKKRNEAENNLKQAKNQNLVRFNIIINLLKDLYFQSLISVLGDETKDNSVRLMSGICVKNELILLNCEQLNRLEEYWKKILNIFNSKFFNIRRISSEVLALIISNNTFPKILEVLCKNVHQSKIDEVVESSLMALGYFVLKKKKDTAQREIIRIRMVKIMTACLIGSMRINLNIKLAGIEALYNCQFFFEFYEFPINQKDLMMKTILESLISKDSCVNLIGLKILCNLVPTFYYLPCFQSNFDVLSKLTLNILRQGNDEPLNFWDELTHYELELVREDEEFRDLRRQPKRKCLGFVKKVLPQLCKVLMNFLICEKIEESESEFGYIIYDNVATILTHVSEVAGNSFGEHFKEFIIQNISDKHWMIRERTTLILSAVVNNQSDDMKKLVEFVFPILLNQANDSIFLVKDNTIFCIGRIAKYQPQSLLLTSLDKILKVLLSSLKDIPPIATKGAWGLMNLLISFKDANCSDKLSKYYQTLAEALLECTDRKYSTYNLKINSYECLSTLFDLATPNNFHYIEKRATSILIQRLNKCCINIESIKNQQKIQQTENLIDLLCSSLERITKTLGSSISRFAESLMDQYLKILKYRINEDVLMAISTLSTTIGNDFARFMDYFHPFLISGLQSSDENIAVASIYCLIDISYSIRKNLTKYADNIIKVLISNIRSTKFFRDLKPKIIAVFGDIAIGIGIDFQKYSKHIRDLLIYSGKLNIDRVDDDMIDYVNDLRNSIFDAYIGILHGVKGENYNVFNPFVQSLLELLKVVIFDKQSDQKVLLSALAVIGDLVNVYGEKCKHLIQVPFIIKFLKECSESAETETRKVVMYVNNQIRNKFNSNEIFRS